jgi:Laminin G domain
VILLAPGTASATTPAAIWNLDEPAGSATMVSSSPNALNGTIGSAVVPGVATDTGFGYQFKEVTDALKHDEHLAVVADNPLLEPESGDLSVTLRLKTGAGNQNIVQKGQANMTGGYWKIDMNHGIPICLFRDSAGVISAKQWGTTIWDGNFHSVTCAKTGNVVSISVDRAPAQKNVKTLGTIDNTKSLSIGGKLYCSPPTVGCDYFAGVIDSVEIDHS